MKVNKKNKLTITLAVFISILFIIPSIGAQIQNNTAEKSSIEQNTESNEKSVFTDDGAYDLIIICPKEFVLSLRPLERFKNSVNVKTKIVSLDEVYKQGYWGRDNPEKIKYYIKQAYDYWQIKYVMFVGAYDKVPIRYVYNNDPFEGYPEPRYISELYYADLYDSEGNFSSWDYNKNCIFGEWKGESGAQDKDIDLYPEVYVGRLACKNVCEVNTMVRKIIFYESNTYGKEWFNKILVAAGNTYTNETKFPGFEGEQNALMVLENMTSFEPTKLFVSDNSLNGPLSMIKAFTKGYGFVYFDGHADPICWGSHGTEHGMVKGLNLFTISFFTNGYKLPVYVGGSCHNAQFDVNIKKLFEDPIYHNTWFPECWLWKLVRKNGGGVISAIGNTGLGLTKEDKQSKEGAGDYMDKQFFYLYDIGESDIMGELWGKSIARYIDAYPVDWNGPEACDGAYDAKTVQQWVLLGDPSLKIGGYPDVTIQ